MNIPSSSSSASSPSFNNPSSSDDAAAARVNPLFVNPSNTSSPINHNLNQSHSSIGVNGENRISNVQKSISGVKQNQCSQNHNHNHNSTNSIHGYHSINHKNSHNHKGITATSMAAGNSSPNSLQVFEACPSRKVHVVYYLSRSGHLEHPHLLEVSIPPNQGLYLRDVKTRLAAIRGRRLPLTFAWSYKRSYKNGYVWQDLCDDDLIFPAHGCEYVLKGSEILNEQSNIDECGHNLPHDPEPGLTTQNGMKEDQGPTSIVPKAVCRNHEETDGAMHGSVSLHASMVEIGTDATTQTEEELRPSTNAHRQEHVETSNSQYANHYKLNRKYPLPSSPQKVLCTTTRPQRMTQLNRTDIASPPSSSSATNSPSPYKELASTSSSSASGFNVAMEQNDNVASDETVKAMDHNLKVSSNTPGRTWIKCATHKLEEQEEIINLHAADEEGDVNDVGLSDLAQESASSRSKYRTMGSSSTGTVVMEEGECSPAGSLKAGRSKHSGALSLLQFMSCGGLDIKEQILPMSLYKLRSKGPPAAANQLHMSNHVHSPEQCGGSESGKCWSKNDNQRALRKHHPLHEGSFGVQATSPSPTANGGSAKALNCGNIPDVISIGRSSISDRSTNASHELEYQVAEAHAKLRKSGEVTSIHNSGRKGLPLLNVGTESSLDFCNNEGIRSTFSVGAARAVSGEILVSKGSPLFVPSKCHSSYSGTPLNYASNGKPPLPLLSTSVLHLHESGNAPSSTKQDAQNKANPSSCNPSRALSEGEVSSLLGGRILANNQRSMTINSYDQSMAQIWEELLAAPTAASKSEAHQPKDGDYQRVRQATMGSISSSNSWEVERTLQNAVELSLQPPLEHLPLLLDCPQCGRNVKAELLKAHVKNCSSPKHNTTARLSYNPSTTPPTTTTVGKSPKSDSNLCQRFLRASPPPTTKP